MRTRSEIDAAPAGRGGGAWADLLMIVALGAILAMFKPSQAAAGDLLVRLIVPGRMLVLCLVATLLLRRRGETWASLGFARPRSILRTAGLVVAGYLAVAVVVGALSALVLPAMGLSNQTASAIPGLKGNRLEYAYWLAIAWSSAALGEELLFRAFIGSRMARGLGDGRWASLAALVGQAALFGLGHAYQGLAGVLLTGAVGLVLGGVYLCGRRNLVACIVLHALIDTISLTAVFLGAVPGAA